MSDIYLDYAATSPLTQSAKKAVNMYMESFYNPSAAYEPARNVRKAVEKAREEIANCIGADPEEIYFTSGSTEGNNIAIQGAMKIAKGRFITCCTEHHSVLNLTSLYPNNHYVVSVDPTGIINMRDLSCAIDNNDVVSVMMVNNEIGCIQPINDIVKLVRHRKGITHTDATQAIGHIPVNVHDLGVDILTASGHKFGAPKGIGFIYVRKGIHIPALILGGGQENGFRSGTENVCGIVAMAEALKDNVYNLKENYNHIKEISRYCINRIKNSDFNYSFNFFDKSDKYCGIINVCFMGTRGEELVEFLSANGVYVSSGSACNTHDDKPSHVLTAIGLSPEQAEASIRISIGVNTSKNDIEKLYNVLSLYFKLRGEED